MRKLLIFFCNLPIISGKKTKRLDCIMKLEPKEVNKHMNTIWRQLEAAKFLGSCEAEGKFARDLFPEYMSKRNEMPSLFDGNPERIFVASLIIVSGKNIPEGFGIAIRIVQDYQLDCKQIYVTTGKKLAENQRLSDIEALVDCMKTSGADGLSSTIDLVLCTSLPLLPPDHGQNVEKIIKHITNVDLKVSSNSTIIMLPHLPCCSVSDITFDRFKTVEKCIFNSCEA